MGSPPQSTPEQRAAAMAKAAEVREARAEIRVKVKSGEMSVADIFANAGDPVYGKIRIKVLLGWVPGLGPVQVRKILETIDVDEKKYVRAFSERQREALLGQVA